MNPSAMLPNRISAQIAIIIVASLLVIHGVLTAAFVLIRSERAEGRDAPPGEIVTLVHLVDETPVNERASLLAALSRAFPAYDLTLSDTDFPFTGGEQAPPGLRRLEPGFRFAITRESADGPPSHVAVGLRDGQVLTARMSPPQAWRLGPFVATLVSIAFCTTLLGLWAARALTAPLRAFAQAAEGFTPDGEIAPLPERGPEEVRTAAKALNRMRARIKTLVEDRTRMLAAVGHDLRTPITRLRLRSEFIEDEATRTQMLRDLEQMQAMVESILIYLRDSRSSRDATLIDLATGVQMLCDQYADLGHRVVYEGPDHAAIRAHPHDLYRAIGNLIDNAVRYGGGATARLSFTQEAVIVDIVDEGPGIPEARKAGMLEPFTRGDAARQMDSGAGFGLGLSIARAVVAAHGGTLALLDNVPTGLIARITLPASEPEAGRPAEPAVATGQAGA